MRTLTCLLIAAILGVAVAHSGVIVSDDVIVNESALAYDAQYTIDVMSMKGNTLSAQASYSSATVPSVSFSNGTQSTGSITVVDYAQLISARASNSLYVSSTDDLLGASLTLPGYVLKEGVDWRVRDTSSGTAASIATAFSKVPFLSISRVGSVVYTTAPVGARYNSLQLVASTPTVLIVSSAPYFAGGRDNASVTVNGVTLLQGRDFTAATSNTATAESLRNAINASSALNSRIMATFSGDDTLLSSKYTGAKYNLAMKSSAPSLLVLSGVLMTGGTDAADTLGSSILTLPLHGFSGALQVLYTAGVPIGGLTDQTTYYASIVDTNRIRLSSSKENALAGTGITVTSTSTQLTADSFTLAPLEISGVMGLQWNVSNDGLNWIAAAVSSITISTSAAPSSYIWNFGSVSHRYLRLDTTAPTTGGLNIVTHVVGSN